MRQLLRSRKLYVYVGVAVSVVAVLGFAIQALDKRVLSDPPLVAFAPEIQPEIGRLNSALVTTEPEWFAGAYLQYNPVFQYVVFATDLEAVRLEDFTDNRSVISLVEVRQAEYSTAELEHARADAAALATRLGIEHHTATDVRANRALLIVLDLPMAQTILNSAGEILPPGAILINVNQLEDQLSY